jgi:hypothetical protein
MVRMYAGRLFITPRREHHGKASKSPAGAASRRSEDNDSPASATAGSASGSGQHLNGLSSHSSSQRRSSLVSDCVDAALSVVDICRTLQSGIGLARASYTEFSTLRIALLVILSQFLAKYQSRQNVDPTSGRTTEALRQPLCDGIAMLKSMSTWGASARFDASLIEAFEHTIARMESSGQSGGVVQQAETQRPSESNYEMFKRWETMWQGGLGGDSASSIRGGDGPAAEGMTSMARALPPLGDPIGTWDADVDPALASDAATAGPDTGSSFGIDWNFSSMPMLEGLSAMLERGYGFGADMDSQQNDGGNRMGF